MKIYKAKKKGFIYLIVIYVLFLSVFFYFSENKDKITNLIVPSILLFLLLWIYFGTSYRIEGSTLFYRSAFIRGRIDINKIDEITVGRTWASLKPAMGRGGLTIKCKYDEVYIAPESNSEVVNDLLKINPKIKIIGDLSK